MLKLLPYRNIRAVVFDLYGTLIDVDTDEISLGFWSQLSNEIGEYGISVSPEVLRIRYNLLCAEESTIAGPGAILKEVFSRWLVELDPDQSSGLTVARFAKAFRASSTRKLSVRRYAVPLCKQLRCVGVSLAIVSNTEALFTRIDLKDLGLAKFFDNIVLSSDVEMKKPNPAILKLGVKPFGIDPRSAVFIGDNWQTDIRASLAANMTAIYLTEHSEESVGQDRHVIFSRPTLLSIDAGLRAADKQLSADR